MDIVGDPSPGVCAHPLTFCVAQGCGPTLPIVLSLSKDERALRTEAGTGGSLASPH